MENASVCISSGFRFGCNAKKGSLAQEQRAVAAAESGRVEEALQLLCDVIKDDEEYASAYNNRAQVCVLGLRYEE